MQTVYERRVCMSNDKNFYWTMYNYYVLFPTNQFEQNYQPIIHTCSYGSIPTAHIWDNELSVVIPALWYILHLPRMGFDVFVNDIDLVLHAHDEPHNINVCPFVRNNPVAQKEINRILVNGTLIICPDDIYQDVICCSDIAKPLLGIYKISELNTERMHKHWKQLSLYARQNEPEIDECIIDSEFRLTLSGERKILPLVPLANQLGYTKQLVEEIEKLNYGSNHNMCAIAMRQQIIDCYRKLVKEHPEVKRRTEKIIVENRNFNGIPLVITLPGTTGFQVKKFNRAKDLPQNERDIIDILGCHRALAKNALWLSLDTVSQEMFTELFKLEEHCKESKKINNSFVWRTLRRIGKLLNNKLRASKIDIIHHVSQITVFSDFPMGLAILDGCTAPLCCIKPISYRPLSPLTKAFQYEMGKCPQVYFGRKLKIVLAECVEKCDKIRHYCDGLTKILKNMVKNESEVDIVVEEISTVSLFKEMLDKHRDADILLISAHGTYDKARNMAGLVIGDEMWMADDNNLHVPPVVLLSACHVMPRGRGVVSVGDLFIRAGAMAVLGTFIPIDVRRNAMLITRLFTNIFEVRKGWSHMRTLDEIWSHVVCTNAVHEIIAPTSSGYNKLEVWANTKKKDGTFPQAEFKNKYSVEKLRSTHAYDDTVKILREIAYRDGIGEYYDSFIKSNGYFPESVFYQFIGMPENVFIRNDVMSEWYDMN